MGRSGAWILVLLVAAGAVLPLAQGSSTERRLVSLDDAALPLPGVRVLESFPFARVVLVEGSLPALDALASLPGVAGVYREEPLAPLLDRVRAVDRADPLPGEDWPTGGNVAIALVDSGFDAAHPGFEGRVVSAVRISRAGFVSAGGSDDDGHGTHVAGILAGSGAASANGRLHGLAPRARLVALDISDAFTTTSAVRAFEWIHDHRAQHGIRVVTNSWGREKEDTHYDADDPVVRASDALVADGLVVVFSAGNRGRDGGATLTTEASNPNVLAVGAATSAGRAEPYSSRGPVQDARGGILPWTKPDLVAPGTAVLSTRAGSRAPASPHDDEERHYWTMNGTSMAAPQVAAAAALLLDAHPTLAPSVVGAILQQTARDVGAPGPDDETGYGMLDVRAALDAARTLEGGQRRIVVETREPVRESGSVAAAQGLVLLSGGALRTPPAAGIDIPLVLPAGAAEIDLHFNWSSAGSFVVSLEGPAGAWPFQRAAGASLHLRHDAAPGSYRVVARPDGLAADTPFTLEGSVLLREERVVDDPPELHGRPVSPAGGFFVPQSPAGRMVDLLEGQPLMVLTALILASVTCSVMGARRR